MSNEVVGVVQECSKMCGLIQGSYFASVDGMWGFVSKNLWNVDAVRNIILFVGLVFLGWRSWTAHEQEKTNHRQAETSQAQLDLAQDGQELDRYQKGAAMLASKLLSERIAGIHVLSGVARKNPKEYFDITQDILCTFVRDISKLTRHEFESGVYRAEPIAAPECVTAITELCKINAERHSAGISTIGRMNLEGSYLPGAVFSGCQFAGMDFDRSNIQETKFNSCNFQAVSFIDAAGANAYFLGFSVGDRLAFDNVQFNDADLSSVVFASSNFRHVGFGDACLAKTNFIRIGFDGVIFKNAKFEETVFRAVNGITAAQISAEQLSSCVVIDSPELEKIKIAGKAK